MLNRLYIWVTETRGVTGFEYSFIAAVLGLGIMGATMLMGDGIVSIFGEDGAGGFLSDRIKESTDINDGGSQL
jgi:Flp pilus assembly pilin Flp